MNAFTYKNGELHAEGVALSAIAADVGTPVGLPSTVNQYSAGGLRVGLAMQSCW